jgi:hypothetical protein
VSLRFARSTGPALLALVVSVTPGAALVNALVGGTAGALTPPGHSGPALSLVDQSPWVMPGQPYRLEVAAGPGTPPGAVVEVTVYDKLTSHSGFAQTLSSTPSGDPLDHTAPLALSSLPKGQDGGVVVAVGVETSSDAGSSDTPALNLNCTSETDACAGVYPVVVSLQRPSGGGPLGRFTTYLTYVEAQSNERLQFAWVVPASTPVSFTAATDPARALATPARAAINALAGLAQSLHSNDSVPVTVEAVPQTLQSLQAVRGPGAPSAKEAVSTFGSLSTDQQLHQFPPLPYVSVDAGALAGVSTELAAQMHEGASTTHNAGVTTDPGPRTWIANGTVGSGLDTGLSFLKAHRLQVHRLVLPDTDVAPLNSGANSGRTSSSPFTLALGHGATVLAAASNTEVAAHFTDDTADPAIEVSRILADLALIHFEAPNLDEARGIVVVPPAGWTPQSTFDNELLAGLAGNPNIEATTLDGYFSAVQPAGASGSTRRLASGGAGPTLSASLAHQISTARLRLSAFDSAAPTHPPVLSQLDNALLASQSTSLTASAQVDGVANFERLLTGQLSLIDLSSNRTITLTARTGAIPITILSNAPYTVTGTLVVTGNKFEFLAPGSVRRGVVLNHPTTPVRIQAQARTSGDLPLVATFKSPQGGLVVAHAELTVRSTATSAVGIVLTALALAVLLAWWARTWRAGRKSSRSARETRG